MLFAVRGIALWIALVCIVGCKVVDEPPKGRSPLSAPVAPPGQMTLEIFSAPVPPDDPQLAALWAEVDENPLAPELRKRLGQDGLRAGVLSGHVPEALATMLKVTDAVIPAEERSLVPVDNEPGVVLRVLQPRAGKRNELVVSPVHDEISLLRSTEGGVHGKTYHKAEGRLVLHAYPEADGRVRLTLVPELHYGELKTQTTGSEGMFIWTTEREKQVYSELEIGATLAAGEMLLVTCQHDRPGSIGHHFFVQPGNEKPMQRLWVLRVAQAGPDRAFADWAAQETHERTSDQAE